MKILLALLLAMLVPQDEKTIKDKQAEIAAFVKTAKNERDFRAAAGDLSKLAEQAYAINKYELSAKLYSDAEKLAQNNLKDAPLAQSFQTAGKKSADVGKEFAKAAKAVDRIVRNEGTPEDFTASGRFLCFVKGDWELGLADLSKGKDESLKKLAEDDLAAGNPTAIADAWFVLLKKESAAKERVLYWYAKAWPKTAGIEREKMRERLTKLYAPAVPGKLSVGGPVGWGFTSGKNDVVEISPLKVHSGGLALRISVKQPKSHVALLTPSVAMTAGMKVEVSVWVLSDGTTGVGDTVLFSLGNKTDGLLWSAGATIQPDSYVWTKISGETICPAESHSIKLAINVSSESGSVWIDDISIKVDGKEMFKSGSFE